MNTTIQPRFGQITVNVPNGQTSDGEVRLSLQLTGVHRDRYEKLVEHHNTIDGVTDGIVNLWTWRFNELNLGFRLNTNDSRSNFCPGGKIEMTREIERLLRKLIKQAPLGKDTQHLFLTQLNEARK